MTTEIWLAINLTAALFCGVQAAILISDKTIIAEKPWAGLFQTLLLLLFSAINFLAAILHVLKLVKIAQTGAIAG